MGRPKQKPNLLPAIQQQNPIATENRDSKEDKFLRMLFVCKTVREAAQAAGYSESYSHAEVYQKFNSPTFQAKLTQVYKDNCYSDLGLIHKINHKALEVIHDDVENGQIESLSKLKHIPRQYLEITKLLVPESGSGVPLVHIDNLQMLIQGKVINGKKTTDGSAE